VKSFNRQPPEIRWFAFRGSAENAPGICFRFHFRHSMFVFPEDAAPDGASEIYFGDWAL
jgi:hypothetical protein